MTRRRRHKVRDSEQTKRQLLDAVEAILLEQGFGGLRTNNIARWIGKDKNLIRYYFSGLNNLLKTYIAEKDYWPPFLERYNQLGQSCPDELRNVFIEMMQEDFITFQGNREMQQIIRWQISEEHPLIRSISESREREGENLFRLTDAFFRDSDVEFRNVIALILGGIYYIVLHTSVNTSVVCGVDIRRDKDRESLKRTIGQLITWAWDKAKGTEHEKVYRITMNEKLEKFLGTAKAYLSDMGAESKRQFDVDLPSQLNGLEKSLMEQLLNISSETQIQTFLQVNLTRLIELSDQFFKHGTEYVPMADRIARTAESVADPVIHFLPEDFQLPEVFRNQASVYMQQQAHAIRERLMENGIDSRLVKVVLLPFERFADSSHPCEWHIYRYLKKYAPFIMKALEADEPQDNWQMVELLFSFGFNHIRLAVYATELVLLDVEGMKPEERISALKGLKKRVQQVRLQTLMKYSRDRPAIVGEFVDWVNAEIAFGKSGAAAKQGISMKLISTFKANQLAFWHKLQYDHGIYEESNLDVFCEKIAYCYMTKGQDELSPSSIKSKLYSKDPSVVDPIEKILVAMLADVRQFKR